MFALYGGWGIIYYFEAYYEFLIQQDFCVTLNHQSLSWVKAFFNYSSRRD